MNTPVTTPESDSGETESPRIRPAVQERSRRSWERALAAGVEVLEESGAEGFTIGAVCDRATISVASIYSRVDGKGELLLAVYDHAMESIESRQAEVAAMVRWDSESAGDAVDQAVGVVARIFLDRRGLMKAVVLLAGSHAEIRRKGSAWTTKLGQQFASTLLKHPGIAEIDDVDRKLDLTFRLVTSSVTIHVAYGDRFASAAHLSDDDLVRHLAFVSRATVLTRGPALH